MTEAEIHTISKKYESFRLRDKVREKFLLQSILEHGIREPLQCVQEKGVQKYILLDGFKRLRCSYRLHISMVPVVSLGSDEVSSILHFIRLSTESSLSTLEQARFVDELHRYHGLTVTDIADRLGRSKAWVSVRLGIIDEMSQVVREEVFSGRFPLRSYMYTLRQFTRVNSIPSTVIDRFVRCVSGKGLSTRDIERLTYGYFRGGERLKHQIDEGNLVWTLRQMRESESVHRAEEGLSEAEWTVVRDLELAQKYMSRINYGLARKELLSKAFHARALLLIEGLLDTTSRFQDQLRRFYDSRAYQRSSQNAL
jgi:DNA-binding MarR family transcriptional regulator